MHHLDENDLFEINNGIKKRPRRDDDQSRKLIKNNNSDYIDQQQPQQKQQSAKFKVMPTTVANLVDGDESVNNKPVFHDPTLKFAIEFTAGALGGAVSRTA